MAVKSRPGCQSAQQGSEQTRDATHGNNDGTFWFVHAAYRRYHWLLLLHLYSFARTAQVVHLKPLLLQPAPTTQPLHSKPNPTDLQVHVDHAEALGVSPARENIGEKVMRTCD